MRHLAATDYLVEVGPDTYSRTHFTKAMGKSLVSGSYAPLSVPLPLKPLSPPVY